MLTKEQLQTLKQTDTSQIYRLLGEANTTRDILFLLENLDHLPKGFNGNVFAPFLTHEVSQVRYWAVKNISKTTNRLLIAHLSRLARHDPDSTIRREAISAIGGMRLPEGIPTLIEHLDERDPKVLLQVIRGLLVFRAQPSVQSALKSLANHPKRDDPKRCSA